MYIYSKAKNRRSGTSMQKRDARGSSKRSMEARQVLAGYPWNGRFETIEQVEKYHDGDEITCLLCGKAYKSLAAHLPRLHGINVEKYKLIFNIPNKFPLMGKSTSAIHSENAKNREFGQNLVCNQWDKSRSKRKPTLCDMVKQIKIESAKTARHSIEKLFNDFEWHLKQVELYSGFQNIPVPKGMAQWITYKVRRREDAELKKRHDEAIRKRKNKISS